MDHIYIYTSDINNGMWTYHAAKSVHSSHDTENGCHASQSVAVHLLATVCACPPCYLRLRGGDCKQSSPISYCTSSWFGGEVHWGVTF